MKMYLEIIELLSEEEMGVKQPQTLRIEVRNEKDAERVLKANISQFEGLNITKRIHTCRHDEGMPCSITEL